MSIIYNKETKGCPVPQMDFMAIKQYLQNGFEKPVQASLAEHIENCAACQEGLEQFSSVNNAGAEIFLPDSQESYFVNSPDSGKHLDEIQIAAFIDNGLEDADRAEVAAHLGECLTCFQLFQKVKKICEETLPETPQSIKEILKVQPQRKEVDFFAKTGQAIKSYFKNFDRGENRFSPALAFVAGIVLMIFLLPHFQQSTEYLVVLPAGQHQQAISADHVLSGLPDENQAFGNDKSLIRIPGQNLERISFTWPEIENVKEYQVMIVSPDENILFRQTQIAVNHIEVSLHEIGTNGIRILLVKAVLKTNEIQPAAQVHFQVIK